MGDYTIKKKVRYMVVRFFSFQKWHNRKGVGSTKIRVANLIKYWPEAGDYVYGEKPDVMIYQKVYMTENWKFPTLFKGIQILDICDPDWLDGAAIKETLDEMDAVVCPTEALAEFLRQLTDKPVVVIRDRFDLDDFPAPKVHKGTLKSAVWFGYYSNAELIRHAVPALAKRGISLTIVSDQDPQAFKWSEEKDYQSKYTFIKYRPETAYKEIRKADVCVLPKGMRPRDKYKSENKTAIARILGLPVVSIDTELDDLVTAEQRTAVKDKWYTKTVDEYNVKRSVAEYQKLIETIKSGQ